MLKFKEFINHAIDTHEVDVVFKYAQIAVEIVKEFNRPAWFPPNFPNLLDEIFTIGNLSFGSYGIYRSSENEKNFPDTISQKIPNNPNITKKIIQQQFNIDPKTIPMKGTIRINVNRIIKEFPNTWDAIKAIATTIAHEATHQIEREYTGITSEVGPQKTEQELINWMNQNQTKLLSKYSGKIGISQEKFI